MATPIREACLNELDQPNETAAKRADGKEDSLSSLLAHISQMCLANNWHRADKAEGGWHHFTIDEVADFTKRLGPMCMAVTGGHTFLDEDGGAEGLIRLEFGACNPKWAFVLKDGAITCYPC